MTLHQKFAQIILHNLEIELGARVGSMEHDSLLVDNVAASLENETTIIEELEEELRDSMEDESEGKCKCDCKICNLAEHPSET